MIPRPLLTGLILAGGQASRMQAGSGERIDKGLLDLCGAPLVAHARRYLEPRVGEVWISANRHHDLYSRYGRVVSDDPALGQGSGPLAGVATALRRIDTPWLMVIPVDVPRLPADLASRLACSVAQSGARIAYAASAGPHPLCMLLHHDLWHNLFEFLQSGGRQVQRWQKLNHAQEVLFPDDEHVFFNINTPEDLCLARRLTPCAPP